MLGSLSAARINNSADKAKPTSHLCHLWFSIKSWPIPLEIWFSMLLQTPVVSSKPKINRWLIKRSDSLWKSFSSPSKSNSHFPFTKFVRCFLKLTVLDGVQTSIHFYHRFWGRVFFFLHLKVKSLMGSLHREGIVPKEEVIYDKKKGV